jgi:hypothetical protein
MLAVTLKTTLTWPPLKGHKAQTAVKPLKANWRNGSPGSATAVKPFSAVGGRKDVVSHPSVPPLLGEVAFVIHRPSLKKARREVSCNDNAGKSL